MVSKQVIMSSNLVSTLLSHLPLLWGNLAPCVGGSVRIIFKLLIHSFLIVLAFGISGNLSIQNLQNGNHKLQDYTVIERHYVKQKALIDKHKLLVMVIRKRTITRFTQIWYSNPWNRAPYLWTIKIFVITTLEGITMTQKISNSNDQSTCHC